MVWYGMSCVASQVKKNEGENKTPRNNKSINHLHTYIQSIAKIEHISIPCKCKSGLSCTFGDGIWTAVPNEGGTQPTLQKRVKSKLDKIA